MSDIELRMFAIQIANNPDKQMFQILKEAEDIVNYIKGIENVKGN